MRIAYIALVLMAGMGIALQVAFNAKLRTAVESPIASSFISLIISIITLAPLLVTGVFGRGRFDSLSSLPPWAWLGGIMGAVYLTASLVAIPVLGAAIVIACAVTGQLVTALVVDNFGLFGVHKVPINAYRMAGAVCLLLGVVLLQRK